MRLWLKILMVLGMTLAILVPLMLIRGVIHDRHYSRDEAEQRVFQPLSDWLIERNA